jgi:hypothetical protein
LTSEEKHTRCLKNSIQRNGATCKASHQTFSVKFAEIPFSATTYLLDCRSRGDAWPEDITERCRQRRGRAHLPGGGSDEDTPARSATRPSPARPSRPCGLATPFRRPPPASCSRPCSSLPSAGRVGSLRAGKGEASWAGKGKGPAAVKGGATDSSGADSLSPGSSSARSPGGRAAGDERTRGTGRKDLIAKVFEILRGFL